MKLVVDTNLLFTFFWKESLLSKLLYKEHELLSPEFALDELRKHKQEISRKAKLLENAFDGLLNILQEFVKFVQFIKYSDKIPEAFELLSEHPKDVDFLALALKFNASILSNDKELFKQSKVQIFDKSKLFELI